MITVVDYDPAWPEQFEALREEYARVLAAAAVPVVAIEHVGSTAVPGLTAKPVIDCDIVVAARDVVDASRALVEIGFEPLGELGIPLRWAFKAPDRFAGTNTYVIVEGSLALRNHLVVRDTLRANPQLREDYGAVKKHVGAAALDMDDYVRGKNPTMQRILAVAGFGAAARASIDASQGLTRDERPDQQTR